MELFSYQHLFVGRTIQGYISQVCHRESEIKFRDFSLIGVPRVKPAEQYYRSPNDPKSNHRMFSYIIYFNGNSLIQVCHNKKPPVVFQIKTSLNWSHKGSKDYDYRVVTSRNRC